MTNSWTDIANATLVLVWGANPVENHPASIAHINRARFPKQFFPSTDARYNKQPARLMVIDPRKNRTALQAGDENYVRIRPGTDIAFGNAVMRYIMEKMAAASPTYANGDPIPADLVSNYWAYLNQAGPGANFNTDGNASAASTTVTGGANCSKYTDARFVLKTDDSDYVRERVVGTSGASTGIAPDGTTITGFPQKAATANATGVRTVYNRLWDHVNHYTTTVAADICACNESDIALVADALIQNSRPASYSTGAPSTIIHQPTDANFRSTTIMYAMGITQHSYGSQNVKMFAVLQSILGNMGRCGGGINALRGIHNVQGSTDMGLLYGNIPGYSGNPTNAEADAVVLNGTTAVALKWKNYNNTAVTVTAVQTGPLTTFAASEYTLAVNGSGFTTIARSSASSAIPDGATVYVSYTHNVASGVAGPAKVFNAYGKYADGLWGTPLSGTSTTTNFTGTIKTNMNQSYDDAYDTRAMGLQQRGFFNMTLKWFGNYDQAIGGSFGYAAATLSSRKAVVNASYELWPKGNGDNHVKMFRNMSSTPMSGSVRIQAAVVWGQNPAVTEPNQGSVRAGLKELDLLVVVDMFETETAACDRKTGAPTYLLPSCSHVEKAGSATNSGRVLQWRYEARKPAGASKDDTELLLRFAKALDAGSAFQHISDAWTAAGITYDTSVYKHLYQNPYGATRAASAPYAFSGGFNGVSGYDSVSGTGDYPVALRTLVSDNISYNNTATLTGSEWVSETIFREYAITVGSGGTLWLYTEGYDLVNRDSLTRNSAGAPRLSASYVGAWGVANRAKSRGRQDPYNTMGFHMWGYSWLVNRRVLYNNAEVPGDQTDYFMSPDSVSRLFAPKAMPATSDPLASIYGVFNYSRWYRTVGAPTAHAMVDVPLRDNGTAAGAAPAVHVVPGRFPSHTEPYETPRDDLAATYGYNSTSTAAINAAGYRNLVYDATKSPTGTKAQYPLVLTTIRCVEHFQGGPITRNNSVNVELEPRPWIELNSGDARAAGIKDGDMVKIVTARTEALAGHSLESVYPQALYGEGFVARVGVGLTKTQRVAQGVVAIPWHWGDRGLSTGSRANDLTLDAMDANTTIPEYKACLCRIEKM